MERFYVEFVIVAWIQTIHQLSSKENQKDIKTSGEKQTVFLHLFYFRGLLDTPFSVKTSLIY